MIPRKLDLACLAFIVIVSILSGYWTMSRGARYQRLIRQQNDLFSKSSNDLSVADKNLERLKTALTATQKELKDLNERIPDSAKIGEFLTQLDSLIKERKIGLINLQPLPSVKEKLFTRIPIRLMITGPFLNIFNLLQDLETMNRVLVIEKIIITKPKIAQDCRVDLTVNIFER